MTNTKSNDNRSLIFISHANPADNNFATWLGSRLSSMGFHVWVDLNDLKSGSRHWTEIETAIRRNAAKVLVVTSRASRKAEGVDNEINIAKGIEKELSLTNFIIQLKVDDLPYSLLPPALNNRLAISFKNDWSNGLLKLVRQLDEEGIPRKKTNSIETDFFSIVMKKKSDDVVNVEEPAFASWLPISLPNILHVYKIRSQVNSVEKKLHHEGVPANSFSSFLISFAGPEAVGYFSGVPLEQLNHVEITTDTWINEQSLAEFTIKRSKRRHAMNGLLNIAWNIALRNAGFEEYELANESAHFIPSKENQIIKQHYNDPMGRQTRPVKLVGKSERYTCNWHAAISARASLYPFPAYSTRLHVAFTKDGRIPIYGKRKASRHRKSFCKNFWNDRWRRIFFALFNFLRNSNEEIVLNTGGDESIKVGHPFEFILPYSIKSDLAE